MRASKRHHYDAVIAALYEEEHRRERELGRRLTIVERAAIRRANTDDPDFFDFHRQDVEKALKTDQGILPKNIDHIRDEKEYERLMEDAEGIQPERIHRFTVPKPQGVRAQIIADVQKLIAERYGETMSEVWIIKCWNEFRALEGGLQDD